LGSFSGFPNRGGIFFLRRSSRRSASNSRVAARRFAPRALARAPLAMIGAPVRRGTCYDYILSRRDIQAPPLCRGAGHVHALADCSRVEDYITSSHCILLADFQGGLLMNKQNQRKNDPV
jgi:hypothetical protein